MRWVIDKEVRYRQCCHAIRTEIALFHLTVCVGVLTQPQNTQPLHDWNLSVCSVAITPLSIALVTGHSVEAQLSCINARPCIGAFPLAYRNRTRDVLQRETTYSVVPACFEFPLRKSQLDKGWVAGCRERLRHK